MFGALFYVFFFCLFNFCVYANRYYRKKKKELFNSVWSWIPMLGLHSFVEFGLNIFNILPNSAKPGNLHTVLKASEMS